MLKLQALSPTFSSAPFFKRRELLRRNVTVDIANAPAYQHDNWGVLRHYRPETPSWVYCVESWTWLHNETVNIHTHLSAAAFAASALIGGLFYLSGKWDVKEMIQPGPRIGLLALVTPIYPFPSPAQPTVTSFDTLLFGLFILGACTCFSMSALFHTGICHSEKRLDFLGILINGSTNNLGTLAYLFFEDHAWRTIYVCATLFVCGVGVQVIVFDPKYMSHEYIHKRTFVLLGIAGLTTLPFLHGIIKHGLVEAGRRMSVGFLATEVVSYGLAAWVYTERFPERWAPGKFDLFGSSHQIMHVLAVCGVACQWAALAESFRYRHFELGGVGA